MWLIWEGKIVILSSGGWRTRRSRGQLGPETYPSQMQVEPSWRLQALHSRDSMTGDRDGRSGSWSPKFRDKALPTFSSLRR